MFGDGASTKIDTGNDTIKGWAGKIGVLLRSIETTSEVTAYFFLSAFFLTTHRNFLLPIPII